MQITSGVGKGSWIKAKNGMNIFAKKNPLYLIPYCLLQDHQLWQKFGKKWKKSMFKSFLHWALCVLPPLLRIHNLIVSFNTSSIIIFGTNFRRRRCITISWISHWIKINIFMKNFYLLWQNSNLINISKKFIHSFYRIPV